MNKQRDSYQSRRRGAVLVFVGVILPALLVLMGVCIDVGTLYVLDARLQTAADLASLSGAMDLPDDLTADATARDIIAQHDPQFMANYEAGDIEFGRWNPKERSFDLGATPYNGIRVKVRQTQQHFLMGLVGIESTLVEAKAIAFADHMFTGWDSGGLIGRDWVDIPGDPFIDAYDVTAGPYGGENSYLPGSALTNGIATARGGPIVTGDVRSGVGN